jgi:hypothetical protein
MREAAFTKQNIQRWQQYEHKLAGSDLKMFLVFISL